MKSTQVLIFQKNMKNAKGEFTDADFEGRDFTDVDCMKNDEICFESQFRIMGECWKNNSTLT